MEPVLTELPVIEEPVIEEQPAPLMQIAVGQQATLQSEGLGEVKGAAAIEVGGVGLPTKVISWKNDQLVLDVPFIGLAGPTQAQLILFDAQMQPMATIPVELIAPAAE